MSFLTGIVTFFKQVKLEVGKVNWPSRQETLRNTFIVIVFSAIVAAILGTFDAIFVNILERFFLK